MFKAEDIRKLNLKEYKYITKDEDGNISCWSIEPIQDTDAWYSYRHNGHYNLGKIEIEEFQGKHWEECLIEFAPNYSDMYGCIGWFGYAKDNLCRLGILKEYDGRFIDKDGHFWDYFEPIKQSDLKFYKDKE